MLETELWRTVAGQMKSWPQIRFIYMYRLENCSLKLPFWALITRDVACKCKAESRRMRVNASFIPLVSSAATLCICCCLISPAVEVSVVHPLLSFGISPPLFIQIFRWVSYSVSSHHLSQSDTDISWELQTQLVKKKLANIDLRQIQA